ncbi:hypothetical protein B5C34_07595 [Pacificimonas flava]|uniref:Uncharacterized protein n=2 Tax=Pacificimonas TaxID=1960290 RepID=A0A219B8J3_9SPHN|nr:hypothetical protein B5C34_07595 [Pacificimonas flava]
MVQGNDLPDFAQKMVDMLNKAGAAMMVSVGHRTGLFDAMHGGAWKSSAGWAREAGLSERYVREWLGAMTTAGIVEIDRIAETYRLPPEHARFLGGNADAVNLAAMMQWIGVLAPVETEIVECFRNGGGVPAAAFGRFREVKAAETELSLDLDATIALSAGLRERLIEGIDVLDVGCGGGRLVRELARLYPNSSFTGYDRSPRQIAEARVQAEGLDNVRYAELDGTAMTDHRAFDLILTFDAVHGQRHPDALLARIRNALRPRGVYIMQDIHAHSSHAGNVNHPLAPFIYTMSCMHCMTVSLSQNGAGLGSAWGVELAQLLLAEAGFDSVAMHRLPHDLRNAYFVCRAN